MRNQGQTSLRFWRFREANPNIAREQAGNVIADIFWLDLIVCNMLGTFGPTVAFAESLWVLKATSI